MITRILVGVDESEPSNRAAALAGELAAHLGARVGLLHVVHPPLHDPARMEIADDLQQTMVERSYPLLASLHSQLPASVAVEEFVLIGHPADEIVAHARAWKADLVVVGDHNRHALSRFLLGSTADRVVRKSPCAVLVAREPDAAPAALQPAAETAAAG
jgi:nucleotide-binding universal stress UspA family protein